MGLRDQVQPDTNRTTRRSSRIRRRLNNTISGSGRDTSSTPAAPPSTSASRSTRLRGTVCRPAPRPPDRAATPVTGTSACFRGAQGATRFASCRDNAGSPAVVQGTVSGSTNCTNCSMSAMDDMTVFTPVNGATTPQFKIPLFSVDPTAYAGQTINVDLFDIGDVGGGPAYVGLQEHPVSRSWAWARPASTSARRQWLGANPPSTWRRSRRPAPWHKHGQRRHGPPRQPSTCACFQTAASGGGAAIYQGQWVMQMPDRRSRVVHGSRVVASCTASHRRIRYWNLVYDVSSAAVAGDTFSVEVGFDGSPDHLHRRLATADGLRFR